VVLLAEVSHGGGQVGGPMKIPSTSSTSSKETMASTFSTAYTHGELASLAAVPPPAQNRMPFYN
jgi:hypothetical protein